MGIPFLNKSTKPKNPSMVNKLITFILFCLCLHVQAQTFTCDKAMNTLGTCECDTQLFIAEHCTKGFFCFNGTDDEIGPYDGCELICKDGYQLLVDPRNGGSWKCIDAGETAICPGKFNTECECKGTEEECPIGECECSGQLRVSQDCKTAKYCNSETNSTDIACGEGEIVYVNLNDNSWHCDVNDNRCPGAFHVGCQPDPTSSPTTDPTSKTTGSPGPTDDPNAAAALGVPFFGILLVSILELFK